MNKSCVLLLLLQMRMQLTRMKYFVLLHQGLQNVQFPRPASSVGPVAQWRWKTMNGRPAMGGCKKCNARENWGMKDDRVVDDGYNLVDVHEWKMMYVSTNTDGPEAQQDLKWI